MQVTWVQLQTKTFHLQGHVVSLGRARNRTDVFSLPGLCFKPRAIYPPWKTEINRELDISQWGLILPKTLCGFLLFNFFGACEVVGIFWFFFLHIVFSVRLFPTELKINVKQYDLRKNPCVPACFPQETLAN